MSIKAVRLEILKPYNGDESKEPVTWNELGQVLRDVRYACAKAENYAITQNYLLEQHKINIKNGVESLPLLLSEDEQRKRYFYRPLTKMFPYVAGSILNQAERAAKNRWNIDKNEVMRLRQSLPTFKLNVPIPVPEENYTLRKICEDDKVRYVMDITLFAKKERVKNRYSVLLRVKDNSTKTILEKIIKNYENTKSRKTIQIVSSNKKQQKWFCLIPYDFTEKEAELNPDRIMGIDLGIAKAVYYAFNDSYKRGCIDGGEIEHFRKSVRARRIAVQNQGKYCGEGRIGHGVKRRLKPVEVLREKEKNFRNLTNHRYARRLVEIAVKNQCGTIQMEDLTSISKDNVFLKDWPYYDLQTKIAEKASEYGIAFKKINPYKTSQRCSRCGYIDRENRPEQAVFVCRNCGYGAMYLCESCNKEQNHAGKCDSCGGRTNLITVNADYNAAKNIATKDIEAIIKKEMGKDYNPPKRN